MGISPDVLASALQELMPEYSELFTSWHPILEKIVAKGNIERNVAQGPYREFTVVTDGPGTVTQILTGSEVIAGGRRQNATKGNTYAPRLIYAFDVPGKDLAEANGSQDLVRILKHYPELALSDFHERISNQLATGNGDGVGGFLTLNGNVTYSPQGNPRQGAFEFAATQTDTTFGIPKSSTPGWVNQYAEAADFRADGRREMRKVYYKASRQGKTLGPVDLLLGDEASYLNYIEDLDDTVRIVSASTSGGDRGPKQVRQGIKFLDADFFLEDSINTAAGAAYWPDAARGSDGVIYFIKSSTWHMYTMGKDASKETKGDFSVEVRSAP